MRHKKWKELDVLLNKIAEKIGGSIHDKRCGKNWDVGQAICAEAYGPNWMENKTFVEWNNKDDDEPPEPGYFKCAEKMADGYVPDWVETE
jgi:hypothetical protein